MPVDDQELRAITFLALRVRRATRGAGAWDENGVMANLRKIQDRNLAMVIEHVIRHAADVGAKSPGVLAGNFTPASLPEQAKRTGPPKKHEECPHHPGQFPPPHCGPCATEATPAYYDPKETPMPNPTGLKGAAMVRARIGGGL